MTTNATMKNFKETLFDMQQHNIPLPAGKVEIRIPLARQILTDMLTLFLEREGRQLIWLPEYDQVAEWLSDNEGRGLFLYGNCGRGKSLICRYVIPAILLTYCRKVVSVFDVQQMNRDIDLVLSKHIIYIDDIGTEEVSNHYGNKRMAFAEIMDAAEKQNKLVMVSTNLDISGLRAMYGDRVVDRIRSTTRRIVFGGDSLRGR